jgi:hypothetical protein
MAFVTHPSANQLGDGGFLALQAFRCLAAGCDEEEILGLFDARLGILGRAALGALLMLVREIGRAGGRGVVIGAPGSCRLTADEVSALGLLGAAQSNDQERISAHIAWLFAGRESETARAAARAISCLFKEAGLALEDSLVEVPAPRRAPIRATDAA